MALQDSWDIQLIWTRLEWLALPTHIIYLYQDTQEEPRLSSCTVLSHTWRRISFVLVQEYAKMREVRWQSKKDRAWKSISQERKLQAVSRVSQVSRRLTASRLFICSLSLLSAVERSKTRESGSSRLISLLHYKTVLCKSLHMVKAQFTHLYDTDKYISQNNVSLQGVLWSLHEIPCKVPCIMPDT